MNWIRTIDKLPEKEVPVYVTILDRIKGIRYVPNAAYKLSWLGYGFFSTDYEGLDEPYNLTDDYFACSLPLTEDEEENIEQDRYVVIAWMSMPEPFKESWF